MAMDYSKNYYMKKPDRDEIVRVGDINDNTDITDEELNEHDAMIKSKAPIESPDFTGSPKSRTVDIEHNDRIIATTAFVHNILEVIEI